MEKRTIIFKSVLIVLLMCLVIPLIFFGCADTPATTGGVLKYTNIRDGQSIGFPPKMVRADSLRHAEPAVEFLLLIDDQGKYIPWLATEFKEDSAAKTITLTLRKDVKFHDGTDFNAEAVKWNLDQSIQAKQTGTSQIKSVDVVDAYTVRINLNNWDRTFLYTLAQYQYLGLMVSPTATNKNGADWASNNPVGTGPFQFVSWQKDAKTIYKKFDGYWQKGKPYLDGVEYTPIPDSTVSELALRKGEIDVSRFIAANSRAAFEKEGIVVVRYIMGPNRPIIFDSANTNSPFANLKVRQAVCYAIDGNAIVKSVQLNEALVVNQISAPGTGFYDSSISGYPYNPTKAKQLLAEAGYANGFKTKFSYLSTPEVEQIVLAYTGFLKTVGIETTLEPLLPAKYDQAVLAGGGWDGLITGLTLGGVNPTATLLQRFVGGGKTFNKMITPDDYVQAVKNAQSAPSADKEKQYVMEAMKMSIDKYCMWDPVYCPFSAFAIGKNVRNLYAGGKLSYQDKLGYLGSEPRVNFPDVSLDKK